METYIGSVLRTPLGKSGGALRAFEAHDLASRVLRAQFVACGEPAVDQVMLANTTNPGNVARVAALAAGLPSTTPALTVNGQCSGGIAALRIGSESIRAGAGGLIQVGGVESVSHAQVQVTTAGARSNRVGGPMWVRHAPAGLPDPDMGTGAEDVARLLGISRAAQDEYASLSYQRAADARAQDVWRGWLVPVSVERGEVENDELSCRPVPPLERLRRYPPAFQRDGSVTAGNCAAPVDGAAVALIGSASALQAAGLKPRARVAAMAAGAGDPGLPALAVIPAITRVLDQAGLSPDAIDCWEINEAFAVKVLACIRHFQLDPERVNRLGGAIAIGHPFAASGLVLLVQLLASLEASGGELGLLALAGAGGVAEAVIVERRTTMKW